MSLCSRIASIALAGLVALSGTTRSQTPPNEWFANCGDAKLSSSHRVARTRILVAPDGKHAAYSESTTRAVPAYKCTYTSRLFVRGAGSPDFKLVFIQNPSLYALGNGIEPLDWSADSRYLLVQLWIWQEASDWGASEILVWDSKNDFAEHPQNVLERTFEKRCSGVIRAIGFDTGNRVIVNLAPFYEEDEDAPATDSCVRVEGRWILNFTFGALERAPADVHIQHNAHWSANRGSSKK